MAKPKEATSKGVRSPNYHLKTKKKTGPDSHGLLNSMTAGAEETNQELNRRYVRLFGQPNKKRPITIQERNEALYARGILTVNK